MNGDSATDEDAAVVLSPNSIDGVVSLLRKRARGLRIQAWLALALILICLLGGAALFQQAGPQALRESRALLDAPFREEVQWRIQSLTAVFPEGKVNDSLLALSDRYLRAGTIVEERRDSIQQDLLRLYALVQSDTTAASVPASVRGRPAMAKNDERLRALFVLPGSPPVRRETEQTELTVYLVSSTSARVGAVLLLLFLVQILVTLYRYTTRLAAFFDARADVLEVAGAPVGGVQFDKLVAALAPEVVDYGRLPATPAALAVRTVGGVIGGLKPGRSDG